MSILKRGLLSETKQCELCGSSFACKGLLGCWCRSMKLSREQLTELSGRASDCICPDCPSEVQR
ncbi:MAG TPA: cysteine-rich CWC family protein [Candidatus Bathyarchaeia archaeon]|nr:cysteine-rich CWC family protein [Candidatus Bathyarchaeia archaeon]